jgi:condensin complex subunit 1
MESFELQDELNTLAQDGPNYEIPNEQDFSSKDPTSLLEGLSSLKAPVQILIDIWSTAAVEAVANSSAAITDPDVFDVFRSVLKHSTSVPGTVMNKVLDSITSGLQGELDSTMRDIESGDQEACLAHKVPLEQYAFLLHWFVNVAETVKGNEDDGPPVPTQKPKRGRGGKAGGGRNAKAAAAARMQETWSWDAQIPATFAVIAKVLLRVGTYWQRIWTAMTEKEAFIRCASFNLLTLPYIDDFTVA